MRASKLFLILIFVYSFTVLALHAQDEPPRLSPKASVSQVVGYTDIKIDYSRPGVKERKIWGGLVPYDEVWRTGANEATTIEFANDVELNGHKVPKGKYGLFTIPGRDEWTIILNKVWDQWGAFNYDQSQDLLRFKVKSQKSQMTQRLLFTFEYDTPYSADIVIQWEYLRVDFTINTNANQK